MGYRNISFPPTLASLNTKNVNIYAFLGHLARTQRMRRETLKKKAAALILSMAVLWPVQPSFLKFLCPSAFLLLQTNSSSKELYINPTEKTNDKTN